MDKRYFSDVFANHQNDLANEGDFINHSLYFEAKTFLHGLLTVEDKLSMANGLEIRVPFLDNDLVEFAMKCPLELKLGKELGRFRLDENIATNKTEMFYSRTSSGKRLLREAMSSLVPKSVVEGKKQGFSSPDASWFKGESVDFVRRLLMDKKAKIYHILDRKKVESMIIEHLNGRKNRRLLIWSLISFEYYLRQEDLL